jgi:hypothetical protein
MIAGSKSYYPNFLKPELPAPNFAGNPNAQGGMVAWSIVKELKKKSMST